MKLKIKKINPKAIIPKYAHRTDTGADLFVTDFKKADGTLCGGNSYTLSPFETILCCTGLSVEFPLGYDMQIRPTSGNSLKTPLRVANSPGTIDSGYRGEVGVIIQNVSLEPFTISVGDKIAQMVFSKHKLAEIEIVEELDESDRGRKGWGSTGIAGKQ